MSCSPPRHSTDRSPERQDAIPPSPETPRPLLWLEIHRLTTNSTFLRLSTSDRIERWEVANQRIVGAGEIRVPAATVTGLLALADQVDATSNMGHGVEEGDVYLFRDVRRGVTATALEPLAPPELHALVKAFDLAARDARLEAAAAARVFIRALPVSPHRVRRLLQRGVHAVPQTEFAPAVRALLALTIERLHELHALVPAVQSQLSKSIGTQPEFFVSDQPGSWYQISLFR